MPPLNLDSQKAILDGIGVDPLHSVFTALGPLPPHPSSRKHRCETECGCCELSTSWSLSKNGRGAQNPVFQTSAQPKDESKDTVLTTPISSKQSKALNRGPHSEPSQSPEKVEDPISKCLIPQTHFSHEALTHLLPSNFSPFKHIQNNRELGAYVDRAEYAICAGSGLVGDLRYGIIVVPFGNERLIFSNPPVMALSDQTHFCKVPLIGRDFSSSKGTATQNTADLPDSVADLVQHEEIGVIEGLQKGATRPPRIIKLRLNVLKRKREESESAVIPKHLLPHPRRSPRFAEKRKGRSMLKGRDEDLSTLGIERS